MKKLLSTLSEKWPEYLIESIVIVASILGAYALDNWNDERLDRQKEKQIVRQLIEDYQSNLAQLEQKITMRNDIIRAGNYILNAIDQKNDGSMDSLTYHMGLLIVDPTFDPIDNDLIATGNIRLLQNEKLRRLLSSWSSDIIAVKEIEQLWREAANREYRPFLTKTGLSRDVHDQFWMKGDHDKWLLEKGFAADLNLGKSKFTPDTSTILNMPELEGYAALAISLNRAGNLEATTLKQRIEEILTLLNTSLQE